MNFLHLHLKILCLLGYVVFYRPTLIAQNSSPSLSGLIPEQICVTGRQNALSCLRNPAAVMEDFNARIGLSHYNLFTGSGLSAWLMAAQQRSGNYIFGFGLSRCGYQISHANMVLASLAILPNVNRAVGLSLVQRWHNTESARTEFLYPNAILGYSSGMKGMSYNLVINEFIPGPNGNMSNASILGCMTFQVGDMKYFVQCEQAIFFGMRWQMAMEHAIHKSLIAQIGIGSKPTSFNFGIRLHLESPLAFEMLGRFVPNAGLTPGIQLHRSK